MNRMVTIISGGLLPLIVVLFIAQCIFSNELASVGATVEDVNRNIETVTEENQSLSRQIAAFGSLESLEARAKAAGFVKATAFINVPKDPSVALR